MTTRTLCSLNSCKVAYNILEWFLGYHCEFVCLESQYRRRADALTSLSRCSLVVPRPSNRSGNQQIMVSALVRQCAHLTIQMFPQSLQFVHSLDGAERRRTRRCLISMGSRSNLRPHYALNRARRRGVGGSVDCEGRSRLCFSRRYHPPMGR